MASNPYAVLGVSPQVSDTELRTAYRHLAQRHHPDHNPGSPEAAHRFTAIQAAYARALELRRTAAGSGPPASQAGGPGDPTVEDRIAALEAELRSARERARRAAPDVQAPRPVRPTPEELGYVTSDDSFTKILDDAQAELGTRFSRSSLGRRLSELLGGEDHD